MANRILSFAPMAERERAAVAAVPARKLRLLCMRVSLNVHDRSLKAAVPVTLIYSRMRSGVSFRSFDRPPDKARPGASIARYQAVRRTRIDPDLTKV